MFQTDDKVMIEWGEQMYRLNELSIDIVEERTVVYGRCSAATELIPCLNNIECSMFQCVRMMNDPGLMTMMWSNRQFVCNVNAKTEAQCSFPLHIKHIVDANVIALRVLQTINTHEAIICYETSTAHYCRLIVREDVMCSIKQRKQCEDSSPTLIEFGPKLQLHETSSLSVAVLDDDVMLFCYSMDGIDCMRVTRRGMSLVQHAAFNVLPYETTVSLFGLDHSNVLLCETSDTCARIHLFAHFEKMRDDAIVSIDGMSQCHQECHITVSVGNALTVTIDGNSAHTRLSNSIHPHEKHTLSLSHGTYTNVGFARSGRSNNRCPYSAIDGLQADASCTICCTENNFGNCTMSSRQNIRSMHGLSTRTFTLLGTYRTEFPSGKSSGGYLLLSAYSDKSDTPIFAVTLEPGRLHVYSPTQHCNVTVGEFIAIDYTDNTVLVNEQACQVDASLSPVVRLEIGKPSTLEYHTMIQWMNANVDDSYFEDVTLHVETRTWFFRQCRIPSALFNSRASITEDCKALVTTEEANDDYFPNATIRMDDLHAWMEYKYAWRYWAKQNTTKDAKVPYNPYIVVATLRSPDGTIRHVGHYHSHDKEFMFSARGQLYHHPPKSKHVVGLTTTPFSGTDLDLVNNKCNMDEENPVYTFECIKVY